MSMYTPHNTIRCYLYIYAYAPKVRWNIRSIYQWDIEGPLLNKQEGKYIPKSQSIIIIRRGCNNQIIKDWLMISYWYMCGWLSVAITLVVATLISSSIYLMVWSMHHAGWQQKIGTAYLYHRRSPAYYYSGSRAIPQAIPEGVLV